MHLRLVWNLMQFGNQYVIKARFKLVIFLPQTLKCWDYRYVSRPLVYMVLEAEQTGLCILAQHFTN